MEEIYSRLIAPTPTWQTIREYYCLECGTLHDVWALTPWRSIIRDFEPDINAFYKDWLSLLVLECADAA